VLCARPWKRASALGFLPGDFVAKVDPYLRPMYDALYERWGSSGGKLIERNVIEVARWLSCAPVRSTIRS